MNTDDYVNIFVELRGLGFGTRFTRGVEFGTLKLSVSCKCAISELSSIILDAVSGTVPMWIPGALDAQDGRDADAKDGARNSFFIDFETILSSDSQSFSNAVMERAQYWPFYCENCSDVYFNASTYAKYLHDSFYLYALALNRTMNSDNDTEALSKGSEIILNTRGSFKGASGTVNIGVNGSRDATFFLTGLRSDFKSQVFMTIPFTDGVLSVYLNYTDAKTTVWEMRGGKAPLDVPICGFDGTSCPIDFWGDYAVYVIVAIVAVCLLIIGFVSYAF